MGDSAYKRIAAKIKAILDFKNMSYKDMGKEIGWGKAAVGHWIRMERTPPNDALIKIADFVGVSRDFFFKEFNSPGETYSTSELYEGVDIDEILYMEAHADLRREYKKEKGSGKRP